jgi:hypothetical protein
LVFRHFVCGKAFGALARASVARRISTRLLLLVTGSIDLLPEQFVAAKKEEAVEDAV